MIDDQTWRWRTDGWTVWLREPDGCRHKFAVHEVLGIGPSCHDDDTTLVAVTPAHIEQFIRGTRRGWFGRLPSVEVANVRESRRFLLAYRSWSGATSLYEVSAAVDHKQLHRSGE